MAGREKADNDMSREQLKQMAYQIVANRIRVHEASGTLEGRFIWLLRNRQQNRLRSYAPPSKSALMRFREEVIAIRLSFESKLPAFSSTEIVKPHTIPATGSLATVTVPVIRELALESVWELLKAELEGGIILDSFNYTEWVCRNHVPTVVSVNTFRDKVSHCILSVEKKMRTQQKNNQKIREPLSIDEMNLLQNKVAVRLVDKVAAEIDIFPEAKMSNLKEVVSYALLSCVDSRKISYEDACSILNVDKLGGKTVRDIVNAILNTFEFEFFLQKNHLEKK